MIGRLPVLLDELRLLGRLPLLAEDSDSLDGNGGGDKAMTAARDGF